MYLHIRVYIPSTHSFIFCCSHCVRKNRSPNPSVPISHSPLFNTLRLTNISPFRTHLYVSHSLSHTSPSHTHCPFHTHVSDSHSLSVLCTSLHFTHTSPCHPLCLTHISPFHTPLCFTLTLCLTYISPFHTHVSDSHSLSVSHISLHFTLTLCLTHISPFHTPLCLMQISSFRTHLCFPLTPLHVSISHSLSISHSRLHFALTLHPILVLHFISHSQIGAFTFHSICFSPYVVYFIEILFTPEA